MGIESNTCPQARHALIYIDKLQAWQTLKRRVHYEQRPAKFSTT